ncbi:MAG TPA: hypothetical protein VJ807_05145 [Gaiellaceae bacterium]|nr:hypothetical protein [Gaiellaceae bacterium]
MIGWALAIVLAAAAVVPAAGADSSASRLVDRTFTCAVGYLGGVYQTSVESYWSLPPHVVRRTASATATTNLEKGFLGGISSSSLYVNKRYCRPTGIRLPLTTKGLQGGPFSEFSTEYDCFTPRRVLFRVRVEFVKPTALRTASPLGVPQLQALGPATRAELAIGTLKGKPIAYASIAGTKARLFTATDCQED